MYPGHPPETITRKGYFWLMKMKCVITAAAVFFLSITRLASQNITDTLRVENEIYTFVERMPEFPGGEQAMVMYLAKNIYYPDSARENGYQGSVVLRFIVTAEGAIRDARVVRGVNSYLDEEAVRVVNSMPRWTPGLQNGKAVDVYFTLPVTFRLE